jgi:hypothetical protein
MSVSACLSRAIIAKYVLFNTVFAGAKKKNYIERKLSSRMKHAFCIQYIFSVSTTAVGVNKQNDVTTFLNAFFLINGGVIFYVYTHPATRKAERQS